MKIKSFLLLALAAYSILSCNKNNGGPEKLNMKKVRSYVFYQYKNDTKDTFQLTTYPNKLPLEIGYSFSVSDPAAIDQLGICLPTPGHTYAVTLWDSTAKSVLIRKNIKQVNGGGSFSFVDLEQTNEAVPVQPNHTYMISVNLVPIGSTDVGDSFYVASRTDLKPIFPLKMNVLTYERQYNLYNASSPTYPTDEIKSTNLIAGLVDLVFEYYTPK